MGPGATPPDYANRLVANPKLLNNLTSYVDNVSPMPSPAVVTESPEAAPTTPAYPQNTPPPESIHDISEDVDTRQALNLGSSLVSAIATRNPAVFADAALRQVANSGIAALLSEQKDKYLPFLKTSADTDKNALHVLGCKPPVSVILLALRRLFGDEFLGWEPETIIWDLVDRGVQVDQQLLESINCGLCLALQPTFLNDWHVFENCVLAMNRLLVHAYSIQKPDIAHMCIAIAEASIIFDVYQPQIADAIPDTDVETYVAVALNHDNYMLPPLELAFAFDTLQTLNKNTHVVPALKKAWDEYTVKLGEDLPHQLDPDSIIDIQLGKLAGCQLCVDDHLERVKELTATL